MIVGAGEWGFRDLPLEEHCRIAAAMGFRYLELGTGGDYAGRLRTGMTPDELRSTLACIRDYGLRTPFMCLENDFTLADGARVDIEVDRVCREARFSAAFGVTRLRLFAGFASAREVTGRRWDRMIRAFHTVDAQCAELGMAISIETHGALTARGRGLVHTPTVSTDRDALRRLLAEVPAGVGVNFDPGNLKPVQPGPVMDYLSILRGRINYCHLKDWIPCGDGSWTAVGVGDGTMDWKPLLDAMDYDGVFLIEYEPTRDVEDGLRRSLNHLKAILPVTMEG